MIGPITIVGAGSWGTALALLLASNGQKTRLWSRRKTSFPNDERLARNFGHSELPNFSSLNNLEFHDDLKASLQGITDIFIMVPSFAFNEVLAEIKLHLTSNARIAWGTKGLTKEGRFFHDVVEAELGHVAMAGISGPSLAAEVVASLPTAVTVASNDIEFSKDIAERLHNSSFHVHQSDDIIGVELCGVLKNVLAIAVGIADGLALGSNARAALITQGLAEMGSLVNALGGKQETLTGLAGLGDLVLTCTDNQSRNRRFGLAIGKGVGRKAAESTIGQAIEGLYNVNQIYGLAEKYFVEMPIVRQVYRILYEEVDPRKAICEFFNCLSCRVIY